jgi:hypothetical protein
LRRVDDVLRLPPFVRPPLPTFAWVYRLKATTGHSTRIMPWKAYLYLILFASGSFDFLAMSGKRAAPGDWENNVLTSDFSYSTKRQRNARYPLSPSIANANLSRMNPGPGFAYPMHERLDDSLPIYSGDPGDPKTGFQWRNGTDISFPVCLLHA